MQGFFVLAIAGTEKRDLCILLNINFDNVNEA